MTLRFVADGDRAEERDLLHTVKAYESLVAPRAAHHADDGEVILEVAFPPTGDGTYQRRDVLRTPSGALPKTAEQRARLDAALNLLRAAVRFVLIRSGESLESVLEGNFREILHSVIREQLDADFRSAEDSRLTSIEGLRNSLLLPLRERLATDVHGLFPEIESINLAPEVQTIERTLSNVGISLSDLVETPLTGKGTGVRGAVLVAMLRYLASNATRGMVFAVEEPEAFLHPAAQEDVRDQLEDLAASADVTLLITTHSPWIVSRSRYGKVFSLHKDTEGRTRVAQSASGDASHAPLLGELFREKTFADLLDEASAVAPGSKAVLLVEGGGDATCLLRAARLVGRPDLLDGIDIRAAGGATRLALQAIVTRESVDDVPVLALLDHDQPGRDCTSLLVSKSPRALGNKAAVRICRSTIHSGPSRTWPSSSVSRPRRSGNGSSTGPFPSSSSAASS